MSRKVTGMSSVDSGIPCVLCAERPKAVLTVQGKNKGIRIEENV